MTACTVTTNWHKDLQRNTFCLRSCWHNYWKKIPDLLWSFSSFWLDTRPWARQLFLATVVLPKDLHADPCPASTVSAEWTSHLYCSFVCRFKSCHIVYSAIFPHLSPVGHCTLLEFDTLVIFIYQSVSLWSDKTFIKKVLLLGFGQQPSYVFFLQKLLETLKITS